MNLLSKSRNGNYEIEIYDDGTKNRIHDGNPQPEYPESLDVKFSDYCDAGCKFCFTPESQVLTINGNKPISSVKKGEKIYSFEERSKKIEISIVEDVLVKDVAEELCVIELENGNVIKCTKDHKIFTKNRGWIDAKDILLDDELLNIF